MVHFISVTSTVRVGLQVVAEWVYGCAHRRTSFPMTLPVNTLVGTVQTTRRETRIVCLECGRNFTYDWTTMRASRAGRRR